MAERRPARSFQDLVVWQKAHALVLTVYTDTKRFPREELYGLVSQYRRAVVSVPANIAEGFRKETKPDKVRLMNVAQASLEEVRYYIILARDLGYPVNGELSVMAEEVSRLLDAYIRRMKPSGS